MKVGAKETQKEEFGSKRISPKTKISYPEKPLHTKYQVEHFERRFQFYKSKNLSKALIYIALLYCKAF